MYWEIFTGASASCVALYMLKSRADSTNSSNDSSTLRTSEFISFQRNWLIVYLLAMLSDWLQGAYVYALYSSYGFNAIEVATLFVAGFGSSMLLGTFIGALSDKYGRKTMCLIFSLFYTISILTKTSPNFYILLSGRVFSGIATSLLFSAFEAWMVCEHMKRGFDASLLSDTFSKATAGNGFIAVFAGLISSFLADSYGYIAPFLFALLPLFALGLYVLTTWTENYGNSTISVSKMFTPAFTFLAAHPSLFLFGLAQSCFEGAMYAFVFMWSPALNEIHKLHTDEKLPFGVIFATFMVAVMCGSYLFSLLSAHIKYIPYLIHTVAGVSMVCASYVQHEVILMITFLLFEASCGLFWPTYGTLRSQYVPEESRAAISNVFRIPLNAFVVTLLLNSDKYQPASMFIICAVAHASSLVLYTLFTLIYKQESVDSKKKSQ